jgi:hypothetical protein
LNEVIRVIARLAVSSGEKAMVSLASRQFGGLNR